MRLDKALLGAAGVHYVCAELYRRGYIALATTRSTAAIDVLASSADGARTAAIQVKTRSGPGYWRLSDKAETLVSATLFYVFVRLEDGQHPLFHIVPSAAVATYAHAYHARWAARNPERAERAERDGLSNMKMRVFGDSKNDYLDRWGLLGLEEAS